MSTNLKGTRTPFTPRHVGVLQRAQMPAAFPICPQEVYGYVAGHCSLRVTMDGSVDSHIHGQNRIGKSGACLGYCISQFSSMLSEHPRGCPYLP